MRSYIKLIMLFGVGYTPFLLNSDAYSPVSKLKQQLLRDRNNPGCRAFLDTIAVAEGTYFARAQGYKMRYPRGVMCLDLNAHPALVVCARCCDKTICSTAAGRYMFLENVWNRIAAKLELPDFSPLSQDLAALYLLHERRAIEDIKKGDVKQAIYKVRCIWSSLPGSPHKQPVKKYELLRKTFEDRKKHYSKYVGGKEWS